MLLVRRFDELPTQQDPTACRGLLQAGPNVCTLPTRHGPLYSLQSPSANSQGPGVSPSPPLPLPPSPLRPPRPNPKPFLLPCVPARAGASPVAPPQSPPRTPVTVTDDSHDSRSGPLDLRVHLASRADLPFSVLQCLAAGHHGMPLVSPPPSRPGCSSLLRPRPACRASFLYPTGRDCKAPAEPLLPHIAQLAVPHLPCVMNWRA